MASNRLLERYRTEIVPALMEEFSYSSVMQVPRLTKLVVNIGVTACWLQAFGYWNRRNAATGRA